MANGLTDNFYLNSPKPIDRRESFATIEDMAKYQERYINNGRLTFCEEDKNYYQFFSDNPIDSTTGKWRKVYFLSKEIDVDNIKEPPTIDTIFNSNSTNAATAKATAKYLNDNFAKSSELLLANKAISELENKDVISDIKSNLLSQVNGKAYLRGDNLISNINNNLLRADSNGRLYIDEFTIRSMLSNIEMRLSALENR